MRQVEPKTPPAAVNRAARARSTPRRHTRVDACLAVFLGNGGRAPPRGGSALLRTAGVKVYRAAPGRPAELYNLANDIGETRNVAAQHPEIASRLEKLLTTARVDSPDFPLAKKERKKEGKAK